MKHRPASAIHRAMAFAAAAAIAVSPVIAQSSARVTAPTSGESALANSGAIVLLGIVALGIGLAAFDKDDPISA